jgi:hypothetical protein
MPKKGDLFVITSGEYSDYSICGHFIAKESFSYKEKRDAYNSIDLGHEPVLKYGEWADNPRRWINYDVPEPTLETRPVYHSIDGFMAYLIRENLVEEMNCEDFNDDYIGKDQY